MSNPSDMFTFDETSQEIPSASQSDLNSVFSLPSVDDRIKVIWGTNINVSETIESFKEFIRTSKYSSVVNDLILLNSFIITLDIQDLPADLKEQVYLYPTEMIPILEKALNEIIIEKVPTHNLNCTIRLKGSKNMLSMRNMDVGDIDKIVSVQCMVLRCSPIIPEIIKANYKCIKCEREFAVDSVKGVISEPVGCECGSKFTFLIEHQKGEYLDKQIVRVQELPESVPEGGTPMTMVAVCNEDLVDRLVPGNRVILTGILKAAPVRLMRTTKLAKSVFRPFVEVLGFEFIKEANSVHKSEALNDFDEHKNDKDEGKVDMDDLLKSIAPSVFGMEDVKKALLLQLFGGVRKETENTRFRGDINILLVGDPGVAKSQLLTFMHRLSDRGMYTSGRGSSAVGLTATVSKDPDTKQYVLEPGALVLSDNGICCIDEFDKMNESTRSVLHEAMEQQTVSIAKAGIITTLNARCAILASCNPVESRYNLNKSIVENINLPPTLLSRFDVVCILIDRSDEAADKRVANHILGLYTDSQKLLSLDSLKSYINKGRSINPILTQPAIELLRDGYCELRQLSHGKTITATTRQLESLIRLSEAHARMRLSKYVEMEDVREALRIVKESLLVYAIDPMTGRIDIDLVMTGRSRRRMERIRECRDDIMKMVERKMSYESIIETLDSDGKEALKEMIDEEILIVGKEGSVILNKDI